MVEVIRAFIAVDIDDPSVSKNIVSLRDALVATGADLKPVEEENLHITIRFLGNIPVTMVDDIYNIMKSVKFKPFKIHVKGVGCFPNISRPRVIWVGVEKGYEELKRIHDEIEKGLKALGFKPEREEFVAHITVARVRSGRKREALIKVIENFKEFDAGEMVVRYVRLKQSILTPGGPIYKTLREVKAEEP